MTEQEWLDCDDVREMLEWLPTRPWRRMALWLDLGCGRDQLRRYYLFASACFARIASAGVCQPREDAIALAPSDHLPRPEDDHPAAPWNEGVCASAAVTVEAWAARWADAAARSVAWRRAYVSGHLDWARFQRLRVAERGVQAALLRCIYGNPHRPTPSVDLDWLESDGRAAEQLAKDIAATNAYARLPELADALAAAGCPDAELVSHCRTGPHARGCWAVELLTGCDASLVPPLNAGKIGESLRPIVPATREEFTDTFGPAIPRPGPAWPSLPGRP